MILPVSLQPLAERTPANERLVERLLAGCEDYYRLAYGRAPRASDVDEVFGTEVPGIAREDVHAWIVSANGAPAGFAGLVCGWKRPGQSMIGILALDARLRRQGTGRAAVAALEAFARGTPHGHSMRIGIVATNTPAFGFWHALGYRETGERRTLEDLAAPVVILEKDLHDA